jgi:hypothetical protein
MIDLKTGLGLLAFAFVLSGIASPGLVQISGFLFRRPARQAPAPGSIKLHMQLRLAGRWQAPAPTR